jgi:hypothetical protein
MKKRKNTPSIILETMHENVGLMTETVSEKIYQELSVSLNTLLNHKKLTPGNLIYIITNLMSIISKYKILSGERKKKVVLILISNAIINSTIDDDIKKTLMVLMTTIAPNAIDVIVDVAKKRYIFKRVKKWVVSCC